MTLVALAGCRQLFGIEPVTGDGGDGDGAPVDVRRDGSGLGLVDAPTGCSGAGTFIVCLPFTPQTATTLAAHVSTSPGSSDCATTPQSWTDDRRAR